MAYDLDAHLWRLLERHDDDLDAAEAAAADPSALEPIEAWEGEPWPPLTWQA